MLKVSLGYTRLVLAARQVDADRLSLCVVRQRRLTQLTANTGLLVTTERQLVVEGVVGVDPHSSRLEAVRDLDGSGQVSSVNGRGQTESCVVSDPDSVIQGLKLGNGGDRAEDLLLHDLHALRNI